MERQEKLLKAVSLLAEDENAAAKYADHLSELFGLIMPEKIGDDLVKALAEDDIDECVRIIAAYYRNRPDSTLFPASAPYNAVVADKAVNGIMRVVNVDWEYPDGRVDFLFNATSVHGPLNHEWLWQLNRHDFWTHMARALVKTGDKKYADALIRQISDWIAKTDVPERWNGPGSAWRTIECGIRLLGSWQSTFEAVRKSEAIPDVLLLLFIASMHRQAKHLVEHPTGGNWLMMEANGTFTAASLFPELSDSDEFRKIAAERLLEELKKQILPDGMHNELSPDYHGVVLNCACNFYAIARAQGQAEEFPRDFLQLIKNMIRAGILLSTPAFTQPRTNDCYTIHTSGYTKRGTEAFGRTPEYDFVNTVRKEGRPPEGDTASAFLPYAGFAVMRSDWSADATYMCFDVGPLGMGHMHSDKLNINVFKGSEELIYDDGGGQYEISEARTYGLSGYSHNTVLVDGKAQTRKAPKAVEEAIDAGWESNSEYDRAYGVYDDVFGADMTKPATHKREVRFLKPDIYVVRDTLTSSDEAPHEYEVLFHMDTTSVKEVPGLENAIVSDFGRKYDIMIVPVGDTEGESAPIVVSGQTEPTFQGWYNGRNEAFLHKAVTVSRKATGLSHTFTTLLIPVKSGETLPTVVKDGDKVEVRTGEKNYEVSLGEI